MSSWIYRKPEDTLVRGICTLCGKNPQKRTSRKRYQALCSGCDTRRYIHVYKPPSYGKIPPYRKYKLKTCQRCGFVPEHLRQLDVHHIDGNHHNNDPNNLETLCANCHRLEHID